MHRCPWSRSLVLVCLPAVAAAGAPPFVARAVFTHAVRHHEPVDSIIRLSGGANQIYYFADLRNMGGQTVTERWTYHGHVMSQMLFKVRGERWRVYSRAQLEPSEKGVWQAAVVDGAGVTLAVSTLIYTPGAASSPAPEMHQQ